MATRDEEPSSHWAPLAGQEGITAREGSTSRARRWLVASCLSVALFGLVMVVAHTSMPHPVPDELEFGARIHHPLMPPAQKPLETALLPTQLAQATSIHDFNELLQQKFVTHAKALYEAMAPEQHQLLFEDFLAKIGSEAPGIEGSAGRQQKSFKYASEAEHQRRLEIFKNNTLDILKENEVVYKRNPVQSRARFGITIHADWTKDEFMNNRINMKGTKAEYLKAMLDEKEARKARATYPNASVLHDSLPTVGEECDRTAGSCFIFHCDASRGAQCFGGRCVCTDGACNVGGTCVKQGGCKVATGGSCRYFGCSSWRQSQCVEGECICPEGTCAQHGKCVSGGPPPPNHASDITCSKSVTLKVRNQGQCGDCWAFSTAEQLRAMTVQKYKRDPGTMSVQYLVDCSPEQQGKHCNDGVKGCCGGLPYRADKWLQETGGLPTQADYGPLESDHHPNTAYRCKSGVQKTISPKGEVNIFDTELEISNAFCDKSVVAIAIDAHAGFMHYNGGILDAGHCDAGGVNHAVIIDGVDRTFHDGKPVHIIQNSWGSNWGVTDRRPFGTTGIRGHILFEFGTNVCNIKAIATQPEDVELLV